jgi:hypothetical protein
MVPDALTVLVPKGHTTLSQESTSV